MTQKKSLRHLVNNHTVVFTISGCTGAVYIIFMILISRRINAPYFPLSFFLIFLFLLRYYFIVFLLYCFQARVNSTVQLYFVFVPNVYLFLPLYINFLLSFSSLFFFFFFLSLDTTFYNLYDLGSIEMYYYLFARLHNRKRPLFETNEICLDTLHSNIT